jgi:hypothetical protein
MDACCFCFVIYEHEELFIICEEHWRFYYCLTCIQKLNKTLLACRCGEPFKIEKLLDVVSFIILPPENEEVIIKVEKL